MSDDNTTTSATVAKTIWTETIFEVLYQSLKTNKPDRAIWEVLNAVKAKGYKPEYIIRKVEKKVDKTASNRVWRLMKMV